MIKLKKNMSAIVNVLCYKDSVPKSVYIPSFVITAKL